MYIEQKKIKKKIRYKTSALLSFASHVIRLHYNGRILQQRGVHIILCIYDDASLCVCI